IFMPVVIQNYNPVASDEFNQWIEKSNNIITRHNTFIINFSTEQDTARTNLKRHQVAEFLINEGYIEKEKENEWAERCISRYDKYVKKLRKKNLELEAQLKSIVAGKQELNDFIQRFLGRDDISIDVFEDDKFVLKRGESIAQNFSEGEKTAISFSYFLVYLESLCRQN